MRLTLGPNTEETKTEEASANDPEDNIIIPIKCETLPSHVDTCDIPLKIVTYIHPPLPTQHTVQRSGNTNADLQPHLQQRRPRRRRDVETPLLLVAACRSSPVHLSFISPVKTIASIHPTIRYWSWSATGDRNYATKDASQPATSVTSIRLD